MLDKNKLLEGYERLDKQALIGGCVRIDYDIDVARLVSEVTRIPEETWSDSAGRVDVHSKAEAIFLRGYAPQFSNKPIEDRDVLTMLPYIRSLIKSIGSKPLRCVLAKLKAGDDIDAHADSGQILERTIRVHIPIITSEHVTMFCNHHQYQMKVGEMWIINNGAEHSVNNRDPKLDRIHMICDYLPEPGLLTLLANGEKTLGLVAG